MKGDRSDTVLTVLILSLLIALVSLGWQPVLAAEKEGFNIFPKWIRPPGKFTVVLGPEVKPTATKLFLKLFRGNKIEFFALENSNQLPSRVFVVNIPETMRTGYYDTSLVDKNGIDLCVHGPELKIAIPDKGEDKPVITKIVPAASYAKSGKYSFAIIGEKFGDDVRRIKLLINDTAFEFQTPQQKHGSKASFEDCEKKDPCLIWSWRKLSIRNFDSKSLKDQKINRPLSVSVAVDEIESNKKAIILSWSYVDRITPAFIAFGGLGILILLVHFIYRRVSPHQANRQAHFTLAYLFIDPKTNSYSLSQLQLILWLAASIVAYIYLAASQALVQWDWKLCEIPENLPMLMGISVGTTVLSLGATGSRGSKGAGSLHPEWGDFITSGGVFAPERLQFFLWTVIGVFGFISATLVQDPASVTDLPRIPDSFIPLMGLSSIGYLAGKVTRKPGPIISRLDLASAGVAGEPFHIIGENLSPRAQVILNGEVLPADAISVGTTAGPDAEFVTELIVTPPTIAASASGVAVVKIVNPDGQSAAI